MTVLNVDHKFRPRSSNEQQIVKAIELGSQILSEILKVDINIRVERMAGWAGADAHHAGAWVHHSSLIKVNIRNLYGATLDEVLTVLGHEFRHAVQTQHKTIDRNISDSEVPSNLRPSYWNSDKEKDARKYQAAYKEMILRDERFDFDIQPEGERPTVIDYGKTAEQYGVAGPLDLIRFTDGEQKVWVILLPKVNDILKKKYKKFTTAAKKAMKQYGLNNLKELGAVVQWIPIEREVELSDLIC